MEEGKYKQALSCLSFYKAKDIINLDAFYALGLCKYRLDDLKGAILFWEEANGYGYKECIPKLTEAYFKLGNQDMKKKKYPSAIALFSKALESTPDDANVLCNMGNAYFQQGETGKACECWQHARQAGSLDAQLLIDSHCNDHNK